MADVQGRMYTLPDVWIRPSFGGKGRKVTGQLEAHTNGFRYSSPKGETLDIMYRSAFVCLPNPSCPELTVCDSLSLSVLKTPWTSEGPALTFAKGLMPRLLVLTANKPLHAKSLGAIFSCTPPDGCCS